MILSICTEPEILDVMIVVNVIIKLIQIGIPIILIVMSSIDVIKAVTSGKDDDISKNIKVIPRRLLAGAIVFLVPVIIQFVMIIVDDSFEYDDCFTNGNIEYVSNAFSARAEAAVLVLEKLRNRDTLIDTQNKVSKVKDESVRNELRKRVKVVEEEIRANEISNTPTPNPGGGSNNGGTNSGNYKYYNQADSTWASKSYCGCGTMQSSACGPAVLAIVAANLGTDYNPFDVANMICDVGGRVCGSGTKGSALYNQSIMTKLNLKAVTPTSIQNSSVINQKQAILNALSEEKFVIVSIPGHFVVIAPGSNGKIYVLDPGSRSDTKEYAIDDYYNKIYNHKNRCTTEKKCGWGIVAFYSRG